MGNYVNQQPSEKENDMNHQIVVNNREEGKAVERALVNPITRAVVLVEGALADLDETQRARVIKFVQESLNGVVTGDTQ